MTLLRLFRYSHSCPPLLVRAPQIPKRASTLSASSTSVLTKPPSGRLHSLPPFQFNFPICPCKAIWLSWMGITYMSPFCKERPLILKMKGKTVSSASLSLRLSPTSSPLWHRTRTQTCHVCFWSRAIPRFATSVSVTSLPLSTLRGGSCQTVI